MTGNRRRVDGYSSNGSFLGLCVFTISHPFQRHGTTAARARRERESKRRLSCHIPLIGIRELVNALCLRACRPSFLLVLTMDRGFSRDLLANLSLRNDTPEEYAKSHERQVSSPLLRRVSSRFHSDGGSTRDASVRSCLARRSHWHEEPSIIVISLCSHQDPVHHPRWTIWNQDGRDSTKVSVIFPKLRTAVPWLFFLPFHELERMLRPSVPLQWRMMKTRNSKKKMKEN